MILLILLLGLEQTSLHTNGRFFPDIHQKQEDLYNIALVKSTPTIPPRHNSAVPIRIIGYDLQGQVAYFSSYQHTKKELDPNIHILDGIHNIKGKSTLYVMVANLYI